MTTTAAEFGAVPATAPDTVLERDALMGMLQYADGVPEDALRAALELRFRHPALDAGSTFLRRSPQSMSSGRALRADPGDGPRIKCGVTACCWNAAQTQTRHAGPSFNFEEAGIHLPSHHAAKGGPASASRVSCPPHRASVAARKIESRLGGPSC